VKSTSSRSLFHSSVLIEDILLIAIAAELALSLPFHRATAAVEAVILIFARRMVAPNIASLDSLLGAAGFAGLIIVAFVIPELELSRVAPEMGVDNA
jgi:hypothetical protein